MNNELYRQIQELILMTTSLITVITLFTLLLNFVLKHYDDSLRDKKISKLNAEIKDLKERLETKTDIARLRYEHEMLTKEFNADTAQKHRTE